MKLSVIIPVYRVEHTLERCVRSVLSQDCTDCEVILVDDGSPDACGVICDRLASECSRIKVVHKENGGLSDARNKGLDVACGDYVTFVDSDDYLAENTYRPLMDIVSSHPEYDILEYPVFVYIGGKDERMLSFRDVEYRSAADYWLSCKAYTHSYAWNKIYRMDLFKDVRFPVGKVFEDVHTLPLLLAKAKVVATTSVGMYCYCWNPGGITATASGDDLASLLCAHQRVLGNLIESHSSTIEFLEYYIKVLNIQCDVCRLSGAGITTPEVKFAFFKPLRDLMKAGGGKDALKFVIYKVFGIRGLCLYNKIRYMFHR